LFEFDYVALGIAHVNWIAHAASAISYRRLTQDLDRIAAEITYHRTEIIGFDSQAKMVDISSRVNSWLDRRDQVDHASPGAKLNQTKLADSPLFLQAQHARVKVESPVLLAASQDNVIKLNNHQRTFHAKTSGIF
jgi:hypothetical protein